MGGADLLAPYLCLWRLSQSFGMILFKCNYYIINYNGGSYALAFDFYLRIDLELYRRIKVSL